MRLLARAAALSLLLACGCAAPGPRPPQPGGGPADQGAPPVQAASPVGPVPAGLPDRITLPAAYRLMLLDGHMTLVRESDPQALGGSPASLRIVAGEISRGELAFQPGLLPQELAAEVAANRESSARMDNALAEVMRRSRDLSDQAVGLQDQSRRLSEMLASIMARLAQLESTRPAAAGTPGSADAGR